MIFVLTVCSFYLYRAKDVGPNMDDRVSIVIALGKFPPLAEIFSRPNALGEYTALLEYTKYSSEKVKFGDVYRSIINDNSNGCIYYFLLAVLIKMVGYNLWWLRSFSVLFSGINLCLIYMLAGKFQNKPLFMWTTLIMLSFNPVFLVNTILLRSYMLALTGCLLSIYFLQKIFTSNGKNSRNYILFFASVLLAAGSHYFTFSVLAAEFVFIVWKWGRFPDERRKFLIGYLFLVLLGASWIYLSFPTSWHNLQYLIRDNLGIAHTSPGYQFSLKNLVLQWLNIFTYFFGFSTDSLGKIRILIKLFTAVLFVLMLSRFRYSYRMAFPHLLPVLIVFSMIFYSFQSAYEGQLINFIPKYLVFITPLVILGINVSLSDFFSPRRLF